MKIEFQASTESHGFLESLLRSLRESGHEARQCFFIPESSYRSAKTKPARLWLRIRQYLLYPLYLSGPLLFGSARKADVLVVSTNTFYAPLIATLFHKRVIHLVYDLFPEAMLTGKQISLPNRNITVGTPLAGRPPYRSRRAELPHRAPALIK